MSSKSYCDSCHQQITRNYVSQRLRLKRGDFIAEIMLCHGKLYNSGDICLACLRELLAKGKEAPK